jgi:hypothetical protein
LGRASFKAIQIIIILVELCNFLCAALRLRYQQKSKPGLCPGVGGFAPDQEIKYKALRAALARFGISKGRASALIYEV